MNSVEKQRILAAFERASLIAQLANRGFYVIGEVWRDRACGQPLRVSEQPKPDASTDRRSQS